MWDFLPYEAKKYRDGKNIKFFEKNIKKMLPFLIFVI